MRADDSCRICVQEAYQLYGTAHFHSRVKAAFTNSQLVIWSSRSLVALVGASYSEDKFGVVQLHGSVEAVLGMQLAADTNPRHLR